MCSRCSEFGFKTTFDATTLALRARALHIKNTQHQQCVIHSNKKITKRWPLKKLSGNMALKSFTSQGALQVAIKFSTLASINRSSTTCENSLRLLCYQMVKKIERLHIIRWVIGSWERITKETITNTWRSIGYSKNILKKIFLIFVPQRSFVT